MSIKTREYEDTAYEAVLYHRYNRPDMWDVMSLLCCSKFVVVYAENLGSTAAHLCQKVSNADLIR